MKAHYLMSSNDFIEQSEGIITTTNKVDDSVSLEDGKEIVRTVEMELTESTDSQDGNAHKKRMSTLEMKTFNRNFRSLSQEDRLEETTDKDPVKIACVGGFTGGVSNKGVFIKDYLGIKPAMRIHPFNAIDFYFKKANWRRRDSLKSYSSVVLQLSEISDMKLLSAMTQVFFRYSQGAMVFWGPRNPASLMEAVQWRAKIKQETSSAIPCVLVTENLIDDCANSLRWIGPGEIFESELKLDQFCKDHEFSSHFEITSRDWEAGEKSVFGKAVNRLLDEIFDSDKIKDNTCL